MKTIVNYRILRREFYNDLEDEVRAALRDGYQPFGNLKSIGDAFTQVMVQYGTANV